MLSDQDEAGSTNINPNGFDFLQGKSNHRLDFFYPSLFRNTSEHISMLTYFPSPKAISLRGGGRLLDHIDERDTVSDQDQGGEDGQPDPPVLKGFRGLCRSGFSDWKCLAAFWGKESKVHYDIEDKDDADEKNRSSYCLCCLIWDPAKCLWGIPVSGE